MVHREVEITAPDPAHSIRIRHRETVGEHAVTVQTNFSVTVKGDRNADKRSLLLLAMTVADGKLRLSQLIPPAGVDQARPVFLKTYEVMEESGTMAENMVQVLVRLEHKPTKNGNFGPGFGNGLFSRIVADFGKKLDGTMINGYANTLTFGNRPGEEPAAEGPIPLVGAFSAFIQSTCSEDHSISKGIQQDARQAGIIAGTRQPMVPELPQIDATILPTVPDLDDSTFSSTHRDGIYQTYQIDSEYRETTMVVQMPIARPADSIYVSPRQSPGAPTPDTPTPTPTTPANNNDHSAFVRLGPSQFQRIVRIVAERHGKPPKLPTPLPAFIDGDGLKNVLLSQITLGCEPTRTPDGEAKNYVLRAEFHYGVSGIPKKIKFGIPDYEETPSLGAGEQYNFELSSIFSSQHAIG